MKRRFIMSLTCHGGEMHAFLTMPEKDQRFIEHVAGELVKTAEAEKVGFPFPFICVTELDEEEDYKPIQDYLEGAFAQAKGLDWDKSGYIIFSLSSSEPMNDKIMELH